MMRVLLDTDVVLDLFLDREPFSEDSAALWAAHENAQPAAYISAITPVNLFYIARSNCTGISQTLCIAAAEPVEAKAVRATRLRLRLRQAQATAAATCMVTARKLKGRDVARQAVMELLAALPVCLVDHAVYTPSEFLNKFPNYQPNE